MIFREILDRKTALLVSEFDELLNKAYDNQAHKGDLLLISVNGFYCVDVLSWENMEVKQSPYVIGPGVEGHSEHLHHEFIGRYLSQTLSEETYTEYVAHHQWTPERKSEVERLWKNEEYSIQNEMLIYQKIWEMDSFLKKLYQLTRLVNGETYDWHLKIKQSNNKKDEGHRRESIIRLLVRDRLKQQYPNIYAAIKNAYKTQVRNSIAHSQYSMFGRYIQLNNKIKGDPSTPLDVVSFDEWMEMIHNTLVIYSQINRLLFIVNKLYMEEAKNQGDIIEICINKKVPEAGEEVRYIKISPDGRRWYWLSNEQ